jgi:MFS family permease
MFSGHVEGADRAEVRRHGSERARRETSLKTVRQHLAAPVRLGLRENARQFTLLVLVNALVGAMAGLERSILPTIAEEEFHIAARAGVLSFILVFGLAKALANLAAGALADRRSRKVLLVAGWVVALPVPLLLMWAPSWKWILVANVLLGVSQGLTWSMTVLMKVDLAGPKRRGLAMGLNEFAGYLSVAGAAFATAWLAAAFGLRPVPFLIGILFVIAGLVMSILLVRDTTAHVTVESSNPSPSSTPSARSVFRLTTFRDRDLSSITQAGLVNNLNDAMAWGLLPLIFASAQVDLETTGWLTALYPATWGVTQLGAGALSDRFGRRRFIVWGMLTQAIGIAAVAATHSVGGFAAGMILMGLGTAAVYPTLLAGIGDVAAASWRGAAMGIYRFWRDMGYVAGAVVAGFGADLLGLRGALWMVATITAASGFWAARRMTKPLRDELPRV